MRLLHLCLVLELVRALKEVPDETSGAVAPVSQEEPPMTIVPDSELGVQVGGLPAPEGVW